MEFLDISDKETCVRELARFHAHARASATPDADAEAAVAAVSSRRLGDFVTDVAAGSASLFKATGDRGELQLVTRRWCRLTHPRTPSTVAAAEVEGAFVLLLSLLPDVRTERSRVIANILAGATAATDRAALRLRM